MTAVISPILQAVAERSASSIVDSLAAGTVVAIFAGILLRVARRRDPATRFAICFSALITIASAPAIHHLSTSQAGTLSRRAAFTLPGSVAFYVFGIWALIAGWLLLGVVRSIGHLFVLRKCCTPVALDSLHEDFRRTLQEDESRRGVTVCTSDQVRVPTAIGLFKPMIVFPTWTMRELTPSELRQILLHELAHLQRWDDWTNLAQQLVRALFFFHPAVWWIENKLTLEREMACDDAVLVQTANPRAYAECLAHLAEKSFVHKSIALAQAALGRVRQTSSRVARILAGNRPNEGPMTLRASAALVAGFAAVCGVSIFTAPKLVAFQDSASVLIVQPSFAPAFEISGSVRITPAKFVTKSVEAIPAGHRTSGVSRQPVKRPATPSTLHLAKARLAPIPVVRAVFVVIQTEDDTSNDAYRIQMWRVTLLRYIVAPPNNEVPTKKT